MRGHGSPTASIHNISTNLTTTLAGELPRLMCIHFDDSSHIHFLLCTRIFTVRRMFRSVIQGSGCWNIAIVTDRYNIPLLILVAQGRAADGRVSYLIQSLLPAVLSLHHQVDAVRKCSQDPRRGRLERDGLSFKIYPINAFMTQTLEYWWGERTKFSYTL